MASKTAAKGKRGDWRLERRTSRFLFRLSPEGAFSYLTPDGRLGWSGLAFSAVIDGRLRRGRLAGFKRRRGGEFALTLQYALGVREQVTIRLLSRPPALTVERVFINAGRRGVKVTEVRTTPGGTGAGVLFGDTPPAGLRCVHVSNLRESSRRLGRRIGPFVCPLPESARTVGDSEGHPFPALAICDGAMRTFLLEASLQQDVFTQMWRIQARYDAEAPGSVFSEYAAIARDGRSQPITLAPGEQRRLAGVFYQIKTGCGLQDLYDDYLRELNRRYRLRGGTSPLLDSALYCTWNYTFFADISEEIIRRQAEFVSARLPGVRHFLIDDGYQLPENTPSYDFGKWYPDPDANIDPARFPNGMRAVAELIGAHGLTPAIWWTPAMGRRNRLVAEHPEWLCLDESGRSWSMDSGAYRKAALDFSVREARDFVVAALEKIFLDWGFRGMKLDFCTYPFDSKDIRLRGGEGVRWWYWLLETIAKFIPAGGFFQVCGGAPYGNPFLGRFCDNYRVGGDIGKGLWSQHRSASRAPLPLLSVPGRRSMLMDVDSAGVRPDGSDDENLSRLNWCFITQGVMGIGGDLTELSDRQVAWLDRITGACDRGRKVRCPDRRAFLGEPLPEVLYVDYPGNSRTARSGVRKHVGFFNWDDEPRTIGYAAATLGIARASRVRDFWTHRPVALAGGQLTVRLNGRASRLLEVLAE